MVARGEIGPFKPSFHTRFIGPYEWNAGGGRRLGGEEGRLVLTRTKELQAHSHWFSHGTTRLRGTVSQTRSLNWAVLGSLYFCVAELVLMQKDVDGCRTMPLPDGQQEAGKPACTSASSFSLLSISGLEFQSDASGDHPDTGADAVV